MARPVPRFAVGLESSILRKMRSRRSSLRKIPSAVVCAKPKVSAAQTKIVEFGPIAVKKWSASPKTEGVTACGSAAQEPLTRPIEEVAYNPHVTLGMRSTSG